MFLRFRRSNGDSILAVTVDGFFKLAGFLELSQNFVHPVYMLWKRPVGDTAGIQYGVLGL